MSFSKDTLQVLRIPIHEDFRDAQLEDAFTDYGPLKRCFVVRKKKKTDKFTIGYVQFAIEDDAAKCLEESGKKIKVDIGGEGSELALRWAHQKGDAAAGEGEAKPPAEKKRSVEQARFDQAAAKAKKARLIIRNLSFKAEEEDVRTHFSTIGEVKEVKILQKPDGKRVGCAFINFSTIAEASKAIKKLNKSAIKGRPVAVDWAIPKEEFQKGQKAPVVEEDEGNDDEAAEDEADDGDEKEEEETDSESNADGEEEGTQNDEEDSSDDDDGEDDSEGSDDEEETEGEKKSHDLKTGHDVAENKTVFVRNIAFNSDEEDLRDMMAQNFGPVLFARLVVDKMTERPRGTAFVKFREPEGAERAVAASESADGLWLDDRQIYACAALSKEDADTRQREKKAKESKDSRNLHLAVEGLVRQGTQAAEGVSKADLEKRARVEKWKRQMLKDLNAFISPTRLCFRNIPPSYSDAQLKKLVVKNVAKSARITECKVIREMKGGGEGKGYGFLAFEGHEDALQCLRKLNNNPAIFGKVNRPIVEFSIENRKAVNARLKRLEKSREKNPVFKGNKEGGGGGGGQQQQRGFKRKAEKDKIEDKPEYMGSVNNPKMRKMPSHTGPKVRHNPRISRRDIKKKDKERKDPKKRKRLAAERQQQQEKAEGEPAAKKKKQKPQKKISKAAKKDIKEEKNFTALVEKYKSKLNSASGIATKQKWFDT